jgi:hypothetical protein
MSPVPTVSPAVRSSRAKPTRTLRNSARSGGPSVLAGSVLAGSVLAGSVLAGSVLLAAPGPAASGLTGP